MNNGQVGDIGNSAQKTQYIQNTGGSSVVGAIKLASQRTGVDFAYLLNKADQESGLKADAHAKTSSATGLFQFVKQTWLQMVKEHGSEYGLDDAANAITIDKSGKATVSDKETREKILNMRHDPVLSAAMAAEYTRENKDYLDAKVGGHVGSTELYLAHFLGASGAASFIKGMRASPNAEAAEALPDAADANPAVFYGKDGHAKSFKEIYNRFAAKFKNQDTSRFTGVADDEAGASVSTVLAANASQKTWFPVPKHDVAELSPSLYVAPTADKQLSASSIPALQQLQKGGYTTDTLFNAMIMAQSNINDALKGLKDGARI